MIHYTCSHCLAQFGGDAAARNHTRGKKECRKANATIFSSSLSQNVTESRAVAEKQRLEAEAKQRAEAHQVKTNKTQTLSAVKSENVSTVSWASLEVYYCSCGLLFPSEQSLQKHFKFGCAEGYRTTVSSRDSLPTCSKCYLQFAKPESCSKHVLEKKCRGAQLTGHVFLRNDSERETAVKEAAVEEATKLLLAAHKKLTIGQSQVIYITRSSPPLSLDHVGSICALDCEGVKLGATGELCLLQVAFANGFVYLFDICDFTSGSSSSSSLASINSLTYQFSVASISSSSTSSLSSCLPSYLIDFLENPRIIKLVHDARNDSAALFKQHNINLRGVIDTQLCYEFLHIGTPFSSLDTILEHFHPSKKQHPSKDWAKVEINKNPEMWKSRPLGAKLLEYAVSDVTLLVECKQPIRHALTEHLHASEDRKTSVVDGWSLLLEASESRVRDAAKYSDQGRQMCFLPPLWVLGSQELAVALHKSKGLPVKVPQILRVDTDLDQLLRLLPMRFRENGVLGDSAPTFKLRDIQLDLGRRPNAFFGSERKFLSDDEKVVVSEADIKQVVEGLGEGKFGPDNRAGINGCLHRISAIKHKSNDRVLGLTLRVGRSVTGNADMITDLVMALSELPSVLILGVPGTGKTTIVREIARLLAERHNVCVVDTSNEICGDGDVPHPCIGLARRMMVPKIEEQSSVMIECLQNHTPDVILIDEIGRRPEVDAARTVKQRGVRLVASAHGDLKGLVKNHVLNGLVGGIETVIVGDEAARRNHGSKLQATRQALPVFDAVIELQKDDLNAWRIVKDVAAAVDYILAGKPYNAEIRSREPDGSLRVRLLKVGLD